LEIRVLIFADKFTDDRLPGLDSKLFEECQNLSKKVKVVVVSSIVKENSYDNIRIVESPFKKFHFFQRYSRPLGFLLAAIKARKHYEIVFSRLLDPVHLLPSIVLNLFFKKKLIVWVSGTDNLRKGRIRKKIVQVGLNSADLIGCNSEFVIREIERLGVGIDKGKVFYVNPGVNLSKFKPERRENPEEVILNVSRINPSKGIEDSIKVIPLLKEKFPNLKFKIAGNFEDRDYLENLENLVSKLDCEGFVEFLGPVPHDKLASLYNSSKLFLFTSKHEGLPNVVFEAMACGLPVISTAVGTVPKIIKNGVNGHIIEGKDSKIIAEKISELLTDEKLRSDIGNAARETVEKECSLENYVDELTSNFKKAAKT